MEEYIKEKVGQLEAIGRLTHFDWTFHEQTLLNIYEHALKETYLKGQEDLRTKFRDER